MLSKSEILITKRFLFSKKSEGYVSIFSWFSIIGISLGVAAIIIVMSVMNGFRSNLTERLLGVNSHLNLYSFNEKINLEEINALINNLDFGAYRQLLPSIETQGLVINNKISRGVIIRGYENLNFDHYLYDQIITKKDNVTNELIRNILSINGVQGIFLSKDFISVNKYDETPWDDIKHIVISLINDFYSSGKDGGYIGLSMGFNIAKKN